MLRQIYNEKEQAEHGKIFEEKRGIRKWNRAKFCVQGNKRIMKWNKRSGVLGARSHQAKFSTWGKGTKEKLRARCDGACL